MALPLLEQIEITDINKGYQLILSLMRKFVGRHSEAVLASYLVHYEMLSLQPRE